MNRALLEYTANIKCNLIDFLILNMKDKSKNNIKNIIASGFVYVNDNLVQKGNFLLKKNDKIVVVKKRINDYNIDIIYEDDYLIGINKPSGLLSISDNSATPTAYNIVSNYVKKNNKKNKIFVLHRLDRETSGILIFAKNQNIKYLMQNSWNDTVIKRGYLAITGNIDSKNGCLKSYLYEDKNFFVHSSNDPKKGKLALTNYSVIKTNKKYSLVQLFLDTGRKNQIRVHMNLLGTSVVGDKKYGTIKGERLYLHANILKFIHPVTKKITTINCYCNFTNLI